MHELFRSYLKSNNIQILDSNKESISFTKAGLNYLFTYDDNDPYYIRLMLPNVLEITEENREKAHKLVDKLNTAYKVAKMMVYEEQQVWISAESFVYSKENLNALFKRFITLLEMVFEEFRREINDN